MRIQNQAKHRDAAAQESQAHSISAIAPAKPQVSPGKKDTACDESRQYHHNKHNRITNDATQLGNFHPRPRTDRSFEFTTNRSALKGRGLYPHGNIRIIRD